MLKKILLVFLITLLFIDVGYSFIQFYNIPFDGDMSRCIVPAKEVKSILENPLGIKILTDNITYPNPNRFFCHWSFSEYFNNVPLLLQNFTSPINSAYLSCALAKIIIQVIIIFLLSLLITGGFLKFDFLVAAILITPLFQTNGYRTYMGIIDPSTTYTFFYALPMILIIIYFMPLYLKYIHGFELKKMTYLKYLWIPLALVSSLSGPLNPGVSLVISLLIFMYFFTQNLSKLDVKDRFTRIGQAIKSIPKDFLFYLLPLCLFSLYSLFLGRFNSENISNELTLTEIYLRLPIGIYYLFTQKLGFPILFLILIINTLIIHYKVKNSEGKKILKMFKWIGFFALIYILLLPLGGYRSYRPNIIRYDTFMPITLGLIFIYAKMSIFILKYLSNKLKYWYVSLLILVVFIFTNADKPCFNQNICERNSINQIANSKEKIVKINDDCTVLSWEVIDNPTKSELNTQLLKKWRIIDDDKLYYQSSSINSK
ncbi:MAG: hypothetical protein PHY75_07380 [Bacteroidales bacterium]|nr:hypothetical protein [Bacteroidales bacterium]